MAAPIRSFTGPAVWNQVDGEDIWMGDVGEEADGHRMSVGFATIAAGAGAGIPAPYDEVWIVVKGRLALRGAGEPVVAEAGDMVYVPTGTPGTAYGEEDLELVLAAHPPRWTFQERDWEAVRAEPRTGAAPRRFTSAAAHPWQQVDGQPGALAYAADGVEGIPFGVGFARATGTMALDFRFPYDEIVVALTKGCAVRADGVAHVVPPGGLVYLPTGSTGTFHAEQGARFVFAHHPTSAKGRREWDSSLPLLPESTREIPAEQG